MSTKGLCVSIPPSVYEDAALALGQDIIEQVFAPFANGKVLLDATGALPRQLNWREMCRANSVVLAYREVRDDYLGGW